MNPYTAKITRNGGTRRIGGVTEGQYAANDGKNIVIGDIVQIKPYSAHNTAQRYEY